jgi:hypothetical protein
VVRFSESDERSAREEIAARLAGQMMTADQMLAAPAAAGD